jgi:hypothetical protein
MKPIIAPTPVETEPEIFLNFTPHSFSQRDYSMQRNMYGTYNKSVDKCTPYADYSSIGCGSNANNANYSNDSNFGPGFNEVGISQYY